ncbi:hypothetical protein V3C99_005954 [Haemonchus contortus]
MRLVPLVFCFYILDVTAALQADSLDAQEIPLEARELSGETLVQYLRKNQDLFEVDPNPVPGFEYKIMDMKFMEQEPNPIVKDDNDAEEDIPPNYDLREVWKDCSSLFTIRDQANCGSCWAVSSAAAISDRICIASKGTKQVYVSDGDIMSCCSYCGSGCQGGFHIRVWDYFREDGVVTGGYYHSKGCCRPYQIHPCGHHGNDTYYGECPKPAQTPVCKKKCQPGFRKIYRMDKLYGKAGYKLKNSVKDIQREIMKSGSVVASFTVYEDFSHYKSGIYKHTAGRARGRHAVKVIGWGTENGTEFWHIANSWHDDWGEKGFFRILRGVNHCGIEQNVSGGLVDENSLHDDL